MAGSSIIQNIVYAFITKSVGSYFRIQDDRYAPKEVRDNTIEREGILLALTTLFSSVTQVSIGPMMAPLIRKMPKLANYELLLRAGATSVGIVVAEVTSRLSAPKNYWTNPELAKFQKPGAKLDIRQMAPALSQRQAEVAFASDSLRTRRLSPQPLQSPFAYARTFNRPPAAKPAGFSL